MERRGRKSGRDCLDMVTMLLACGLILTTVLHDDDLFAQSVTKESNDITVSLLCF